MGWTCEGSCGELSPNEVPFHGDDDAHWCPRPTCSSKARWTPSVKLDPRPTWREKATAEWAAQHGGDDGSPPTAPREPTAAERDAKRTPADRERDRRILDGIRERAAELARRRKGLKPRVPISGPAGRVKMKRSEVNAMTQLTNRILDDVTELRRTSNGTATRHGECTVCGKEGWMLRTFPQKVCAKCHRSGRAPAAQARPEGGHGDYAPRRPKLQSGNEGDASSSMTEDEEEVSQTTTVRRTRKRQVPEPEKFADPLGQEITAIGICARALAGLDGAAIRRVLTYVADVHRHKLTLADGESAAPLTLPGAGRT